jgi:hypothetical protein
VYVTQTEEFVISDKTVRQTTLAKYNGVLPGQDYVSLLHYCNIAISRKYVAIVRGKYPTHTTHPNGTVKGASDSIWHHQRSQHQSFGSFSIDASGAAGQGSAL